jgi:hypothetical protein
MKSDGQKIVCRRKQAQKNCLQWQQHKKYCLHWRNVHPLLKKIMVRPLLASYVIITQLWFISYIIWFDYGLASGPRGGGGVKMKTEMFKLILLWLPPPKKKIYIQYLLMPRTVIRVTRNPFKKFIITDGVNTSCTKLATHFSLHENIWPPPCIY